MNDVKEILLFGNIQEDEPVCTIVNDAVMGGSSFSHIVYSPEKFLIFSGNLSLENNGGFASFRMNVNNNKHPGFNWLSFRLKGDGKQYRFRIRNEYLWEDVAYSYSFRTINDIWMQFDIPLTKFVPVYRGKQIRHPGGLKSEDIRQIGLLISDKQSGPFSVMLEWVKCH